AGHAWMLDNGPGWETLYTWCGDGAEMCASDAQAWDAGPGMMGCALDPPGVLDDRPWVAYGHGKLVLVNNGNGVAQVGLYDPATQARAWNMCAGRGWIPGPPAVREADGMFAVPLVASQRLAFLLADTREGPLTVLLGQDPMALRTATVLGTVPTNLACGTNYGFAGFTRQGTLVVAAATDARHIAVAASDDLRTWRVSTFDAGGDVGYLWLSAGPGQGALLSWVTTEDACLAGDFHVAHVDLAAAPRLRDAMVLAADVAGPCGDYSGSALGPDGRAYVAVFSAPHGCLDLPGDAPLTLYVQTGGPTV
ncbi:MAG: hypothetical protein LC624_03365, partial [Halobacteriales archaeon]|nr:hypothetical protein [Halobacteriales archaeon]